MSTKFSMRLEGAKELAQALREMPKHIAKNVLKKALNKIAEPIAADARSRAPLGLRKGKKGGGAGGFNHLKFKIGVSPTLSRRQRKSLPKDVAAVYVGASPARHAVLVEFGTGPRHRNSFDAPGETGVMPAKPFMRPAWEANKNAAMAMLEKILRTEIEAAAKRLAKRR